MRKTSRCNRCAKVVKYVEINIMLRFHTENQKYKKVQETVHYRVFTKKRNAMNILKLNEDDCHVFNSLLLLTAGKPTTIILKLHYWLKYTILSIRC